MGAIAYGQQTVRERPDETTAVVLVTDGEPGLLVDGAFVPGCANNDVDHVAAAAASAYAAPTPIRTFVIGVGPDLARLDAIAIAGGTAHAFMISVSDPTQTAGQLRQAFEAIRSQVQLSCEFGLPPPPAGQALDPYRVNVAYTSGAGQETPLVYSADCSASNGWRYDDLANPQRIELCTATCTTARADRDGKLTIAFGCQTNEATR
jgi:hypothetical protein